MPPLGQEQKKNDNQFMRKRPRKEQDHSWAVPVGASLVGNMTSNPQSVPLAVVHLCIFTLVKS